MKVLNFLLRLEVRDEIPANNFKASSYYPEKMSFNETFSHIFSQFRKNN